jgi:exodeoxyribonuclease V alpha subunit
LLEALLPRGASSDAEPQHRAVLMAAERSVTVLTGGPGTGKTHTIARLVAVLLADAAERGEPVRIALAAPTGKAAARLREALDQAADTGLGGAVASSSMSGQLREIPALTLHRLLGPLPAVRTRFEFDAERPLPYDVVVLDETSMVPLPMMARLLEGLRPGARLVLVGDPDQLASVDVGAILGDVVAAAASSSASPLSLASVRLLRGHRQQHGSEISVLSDAIRDGRADDALDLLRGGGDVTFLEHRDPLSAADGAGVRDIVSGPLSACRAAALAGDAETALDVASRVRVLCAHRRGRFGAEAWNTALGSWMLGRPHPPRHFAGRSLLVTRNDLRHRLSNGDSGVLVSRDDRLLAAFRVAGEVRTFAPVQLESVDTAFATTVHKSQGSEYDTVVIVLPPAGSPLARRELLYTAVTRATRRVVVVGSSESFLTSASTRAPRSTGLIEALTA